MRIQQPQKTTSFTTFLANQAVATQGPFLALAT